ncbi:MAG: response regulator [Candidatus Brocadiae bacterium]|nr:response regulator [Candidatus Brocadiia bacterium]
MGNAKETQRISEDHNELPVVVAVDDEQILLDFYEEVLKPYCKLYAFNNVKDALAFISNNKVALVITDRHIPFMSGDELCSRLRSQPQTQSLPIIVVSGMEKDIEEIAEMMTKKSIETYLTKPLSIDRLVSNVKFYLKLEKSIPVTSEKQMIIDNM